ncbi:MAG: STAS domain-containing protein [Planctomycetota bacterium]|nr:STAS domain-containing protein [Planctomycetota bacterium]
MRQDGSVATVARGAGEGAILTLEGDVTILVADELLTAAREAAGHGNVTVDLGGVEHIDTAGLQVLLALRRTLTGSSRTLTLANVPERVQRFLAISALLAPLGVEAATTGAVEEDSR